MSERDRKERAKKHGILHELGGLCDNSEKNAVPGRTLVEFLRTRVSEEVAEEAEGILTGLKKGDNAPPSRNQVRDDGRTLRSGAILGGKSVWFKQESVEAYVSRKLGLVTGATANEDRIRLGEDVENLENMLASSTTEGVQLAALLQGATETKGDDDDDDDDEGEVKGEEPVGDITLYNVTEKVAHLEKVYEKAQAGGDDEKTTLTAYIDAELDKMFSRVVEATEATFDSFDKGETPHIANIKDLLDAKRKIKETRSAFKLGRAGRAPDDLALDEEVLPIVFPGSPRSFRGDNPPRSPRSAGSHGTNLMVSKISLAVASRLPQISAVKFENQLRFLLNQVSMTQKSHAVLAVKALSEDLPHFLRSENLLSFHAVANPALQAKGASTSLSLERACSAAALEGILMCITADKLASKKRGSGKEKEVEEKEEKKRNDEEKKKEKETGDRVSAVMESFADTRALLRNCHAYYKEHGGITAEWLEEAHALLFAAMYPSYLRPGVLLAVYEYSTLVVFFAAMALNEDVEVTYEHAADWFGAIFM